MGGRRPRERCEETESCLRLRGYTCVALFGGGLSKLGWCLLFSAVLWVSGFWLARCGLGTYLQVYGLDSQ